ncbi:uncharacterized protein LOC108927415 [Scleropages formosus]|uniref:uncharacterized protein LOC108927415 n=1 Tax=Scleropages formosus TaxID=113540 RepID=UPI000878EFD4|nr:uncharacterized protein LOC108927415 [Scleropages formosus]
MALNPTQWAAAAVSDVALCLSALYAAFHLFKDHRASAVGLFLVGLSAGLSSLAISSPALISLEEDLEWAGAVLGPALVSFDFLWLSEDRLTAHVVLMCSALLPMPRDWFSQEGLVLLSRCLALSSLSCSLTVSLFTGNGAGALASVALSLPTLVAPKGTPGSLASLVTREAAQGPLTWLLKGLMAVGCLSTKRALGTYLLDLKQVQ